MFKKIINLFKVKPIDDSLLAKKVDSMPAVKDQITDAVTSQQADVLKAAVEEKIAPEPAAAKPKKTGGRKKKTQ
jgi:hypothetical protein